MIKCLINLKPGDVVVYRNAVHQKITKSPYHAAPTLAEANPDIDFSKPEYLLLFNWFLYRYLPGGGLEVVRIIKAKR